VGTVPWWSGGDTEWHHTGGLRSMFISMYVLLGHESSPGVTHPPRSRNMEELLNLLLRFSRVLAKVLIIRHQLWVRKQICKLTHLETSSQTLFGQSRPDNVLQDTRRVVRPHGECLSRRSAPSN
jgi:hypothetical protein